MSTSAAIQEKIRAIPPGKPFASKYLLPAGSRAAVDKTLSRMVSAGTLTRVTHGVYVRPKQSRFVGRVMPNVNEVVQTITEANGETIQVHGAEAARRFKLSTQVPALPVFYTSGSSREIRVGKLRVKLIHAAPRKLQLAGTPAGLALSALWYLGKEGVNRSVVESVCNALESNDLNRLLSADTPAWLAEQLSNYARDARFDRTIPESGR